MLKKFKPTVNITMLSVVKRSEPLVELRQEKMDADNIIRNMCHTKILYLEFDSCLAFIHYHRKKILIYHTILIYFDFLFLDVRYKKKAQRQLDLEEEEITIKHQQQADVSDSKNIYNV